VIHSEYNAEGPRKSCCQDSVVIVPTAGRGDTTGRFIEETLMTLPGNSQEGEPVNRRQRRAVSRRAAILGVSLVIVGALTVIGILDAGAVGATVRGVPLLYQSQSPGWIPYKLQFEVISRQLRDLVPAGAKIYSEQPADDPLWTQRIPEFAALYGIVVVKDPGEADYLVSVVGAPDAPSNGGVRLSVKRVG
jgi:hypothetical protein